MEVQHLHTPVVSSTARQAKHQLMTCNSFVLHTGMVAFFTKCECLNVYPTTVSFDQM